MIYRCNACGEKMKEHTGIAMLFTLPDTKDIYLCEGCMEQITMGFMKMLQNNINDVRWKRLLAELVEREKL